MAKNHRQSTIDALNKFSQRQLDKDKPKESRAHYEKPEKEVEKACLKWMRTLEWHVEIYEAKATWSPDAGRWLQQGMKAGTCDCMGNTADGVGVAVEFKAPGRLSTFNSPKRYLQREFIVNKIQSNCFACVVDSVDRLECIYIRWSELRATDKNRAREYLISMLPVKSSKKIIEDDDPLFDD